MAYDARPPSHDLEEQRDISMASEPRGVGGGNVRQVRPRPRFGDALVARSERIPRPCTQL